MLRFAFCLGISLVVNLPHAVAVPIVVAPTSFVRSGVAGCPDRAALIGVDPATNTLLCDDGFATPNTSASYFTGEILDAPTPAGTRFSVFPPLPGAPTSSGVTHNYAGSTMHACPGNEFLTGFSVGSNSFLCSSPGGTPATTLRRVYLTRPVSRFGISACPIGSAMKGVHLINNLFLCADLPHCAQDAHCRSAARCETQSLPPRDEDLGVILGPGICRPSGRLVLRERNGCNGDSVGWLTDRSGNLVNLTRSDSFENDEAQSVTLESVSAGTIIRIFDRSDGRRSDDFSEILVRLTTPATYCVPTFEFTNGFFADGVIEARWNQGDNLDEKVSRVEVYTAILGSGPKCLDVNQNNSSVQLFPCHMGHNQSWTQLPDGTVRAWDGRCLEAPASVVLGWTAGSTRSAALRIAPCSGGPNQVWARTSASELRMFSDMCMDVVGGGNADATPVQIYPCHGGANQRWFASF